MSLSRLFALRFLLLRCSSPDNTWFVHLVPSCLYSDTLRPEMSSAFPLQETVIQPSHMLPIHFSGNVPTVFLLRREGKYQGWEQPGPCVILLGWMKRRSGCRSRGGC